MLSSPQTSPRCYPAHGGAQGVTLPQIVSEVSLVFRTGSRHCLLGSTKPLLPVAGGVGLHPASLAPFNGALEKPKRRSSTPKVMAGEGVTLPLMSAGPPRVTPRPTVCAERRLVIPRSPETCGILPREKRPQHGITVIVTWVRPQLRVPSTPAGGLQQERAQSRSRDHASAVKRGTPRRESSPVRGQHEG